MQSHDEYAFFYEGKKVCHTINNPGGGIAPKSCLPAALKQQMKNKKKTQQNEQNTRRRKVSMAFSDNKQELEEPPASFKSAVWEVLGTFWVPCGLQ